MLKGTEYALIALVKESTNRDLFDVDRVRAEAYLKLWTHSEGDLRYFLVTLAKAKEKPTQLVRFASARRRKRRAGYWNAR